MSKEVKKDAGLKEKKDTTQAEAELGRLTLERARLQVALELNAKRTNELLQKLNGI